MSDIGSRSNVPPGTDLYRDIFINCADAIVIIDSDQLITGINRSAEEMFGYSQSILIGHSLHTLVPEKSRSRHHALVSAFGKSDSPARFMQDRATEIYGRRADMTEFPINVSILKSGEGDDRSLVAIVRDISSQKSIEADLEKLAGTDALTGLLNRRNVILRAKEEFERSTRYDHPMAVAMIDIDRFKQVNDTFGHIAGDRVICQIADTISSGLRKPDKLGRWGGEEFLLILPEVNGAASVNALQRHRRDIENISFPVGGEAGKKFTLTVSIGVTDLREGDKTIEDLIARADEALYLAKRSGRNRVCALDTAGRFSANNSAA